MKVKKQDACFEIFALLLSDRKCRSLWLHIIFFINCELPPNGTDNHVLFTTHSMDIFKDTVKNGPIYFTICFTSKINISHF